MDEIWRGKFFTLPFLYAGSWRRIMFPEHGMARTLTLLAETQSHGFEISRHAILGASMPT